MASTKTCCFDPQLLDPLEAREEGDADPTLRVGLEYPLHEEVVVGEVLVGEVVMDLLQNLVLLLFGELELLGGRTDRRVRRGRRRRDGRVRIIFSFGFRFLVHDTLLAQRGKDPLRSI